MVYTGKTGLTGFITHSDVSILQLLDEIKTAAGSLKDSSPYRPLPSTILSSDNLTFGKYLESRSNAISVAISDIFSTGYKSAPEIRDLSDRIAQLLSTEKSHVNELEKIRLEKEQMQERLETASMRYMVAEKKLDRAKSTTIAKLERQAMVGGRSESGSGLGGSTDGTSGKNESTNGQVDGESLAEAEAAKKKAVAASAKQAEQLEKLSAENDKLTSQVTSLTLKMSHLSDEDYAHTDLFKQLKHQHEDVVIKLNGLEAANADLQQETKRLREERSSFRMQLDAETQAAVSEKEMQLTKAESDLARIRTTRDELNADVQIRKAAQEQERASVNQVNQLVAVKDDRIATLEAEIERLSSSLSEATPSELDSLPIEELRAKYQNLENQYTMLNKELTSMSTAYKRLSATVSQKVGNASDQEEKAIRLSAEKAKADQKYFAAMKAKEARDQEVRVLRAQNSKSSDIVSQLKDAEAATQTLVVNLERQIAESKDLLSTLETKHRAVQRQVSEKDILVEGLRKQVSELKTSLVSKDSAYWTASNAQRKAEVEVEKLKIDVAEKEKRIETWKGRGLGSENEHYEALRVRMLISLNGTGS